ncbi:hypothetical protein Dda_3996 [Drechslerella dactyloides]|uniref:Peptide hydrolase n=1 Tax=Drechslerella dactyloides TaxID=74499 RepID=A0AAD6J3E3_DREDA|nr:hypothetical protein Dda_3996 [Drechslerella dactyloides]
MYVKLSLSPAALLLATAATTTLASPFIVDQQQQQKPLDAASHHRHANKPPVNPFALAALMNTTNLITRSKDLYAIAKMSIPEHNHPTRVIGSLGHVGTIKYIQQVLATLDGYYTFGEQIFPAVSGTVYESRLVLGKDVIAAQPMSLTPPTAHKKAVFAPLVAVDNQGCDTTDYPATVAGAIALIKRGSCSFSTKSENAGIAGAVAAVVYNNEAGKLSGTLGTPLPHHVATFGISDKIGKQLLANLTSGHNITGSAYIDAEVKTIHTRNVIAQTVLGDPQHCVMLGGHSDSVEEGPGINDDGSGSLTLLELAVQLAKFSVPNCVRFAWWSGEEEGLLGSTWYAEHLTAEENMRIRLFMDYDMLASPNFAYQVYNATDIDNPVGSAALRQLYQDIYKSLGVNYTFIEFDGRSDYVGFIEAGIPAGGVATGAEGVKTAEEVDMFGGRKGVWYDPCYHQLCDDLRNVNETAWGVNARLVAASVGTYAQSFAGFPRRQAESEEARAQRRESERRRWKYRGRQLVM